MITTKRVPYRVTLQVSSRKRVTWYRFATGDQQARAEAELAADQQYPGAAVVAVQRLTKREAATLASGKNPD